MRTAVMTKIVRVHLAGGVAVDVHVPTTTTVSLEGVVARALELAGRTFELAGTPLVVALDSSQTLPGDVAQPSLPARQRATQRMTPGVKSRRMQSGRRVA